MMPQARSLGEMEAMPMAPRSQPTSQVDDRYQSLMDEIASLKAQIDALQTPVVEEAPMMPIEPEVAEAPMMPSAPSVTVEQLQNRMVSEPQKLPPVPPRRVIHRGPTGSVEIYDYNMRKEPDMSNFFIKRTTQAPSQDIQASIDYLAKLPKMNIPQIPDIEQIRQKMEEANMTFPEPISYQDQLQAIKDLPPMPNNFMGDSARNVMSQIQQPQMQSFGRPQLPFQGGFMPEMRAGGGGIDKAIYDLKFKLNG
jgi:hypothetical protein